MADDNRREATVADARAYYVEWCSRPADMTAGRMCLGAALARVDELERTLVGLVNTIDDTIESDLTRLFATEAEREKIRARILAADPPEMIEARRVAGTVTR